MTPQPRSRYADQINAELAQNLAGDLLIASGNALMNHGADPELPVILAVAYYTALKEMQTVTPKAVRILKELVATL